MMHLALILMAFQGSPLPADPAWMETGPEAASRYGERIAASTDLNGDGCDDLVISAPGLGALFVHYGSPEGLTGAAVRIDIVHDAVAAAGDVNGDGYGDIIVGNGGATYGSASLLLGGPSGLSSIPAWTYTDTVSGTQFGACVAAGDVNGDGYSDVVVGAPLALTPMGNGKVRVFLGGPLAALPPIPVVTLILGQRPFSAGTEFGRTIAVGDISGDGCADVIVGAPAFDRFAEEQRDGAVFAFLGSASGVSTTAAWQQLGGYASNFGAAVIVAGDTDGDGFGEILVGAPSDANQGGQAFLYSGFSDGATAEPTCIFVGGSRFDALGESLAAAGDVDGDGYADVLIGVPGLRWPGTAERWGEVRLHRGGPLGLSAEPDWTARGEYLRTGFAGWLATCGDLNGDGASDVVVGAPDWYSNGTDYGRVYAWFGPAPQRPAGVQQYPTGGFSPLAVGAVLSEPGFTLRAALTDARHLASRLEVELKALGAEFTGDAGALATGEAVAEGTEASVAIGGLQAGVAYHWRARAVNVSGVRSPWVGFGGNAESDADVSVRINTAPAISNLRQVDPSTGASLPEGGRLGGRFIMFMVAGGDGDLAIDPGERVTLELELRPADIAFSGTPTANGVASPPGADLSLLVDLGETRGSGRWQARLRDRFGATGPWTAFGGAEGADYTIQEFGSLGRSRCGGSAGVSAGGIIALLALISCGSARRIRIPG